MINNVCRIVHIQSRFVWRIIPRATKTAAEIPAILHVLTMHVALAFGLTHSHIHGIVNCSFGLLIYYFTIQLQVDRNGTHNIGSVHLSDDYSLLYSQLDDLQHRKSYKAIH